MKATTNANNYYLTDLEASNRVGIVERYAWGTPIVWAESKGSCTFVDVHFLKTWLPE
jgi:hypothetical protein